MNEQGSVHRMTADEWRETALDDLEADTTLTEESRAIRINDLERQERQIRELEEIEAWKTGILRSIRDALNSDPIDGETVAREIGKLFGGTL